MNQLSLQNNRSLYASCSASIPACTLSPLPLARALRHSALTGVTLRWLARRGPNQRFRGRWGGGGQMGKERAGDSLEWEAVSSSRSKRLLNTSPPTTATTSSPVK
ncbi:hypothetical protein E2C01_041588 [Portunus trituberculatus]|uniref:Uncharacterized protein n=1 Tax=Portunus trituberculatus TaxID=210409 RepID=A0A5B7FJM8_PORTR|nr:hypothetical protein [Portunus trituberculatus]